MAGVYNVKMAWHEKKPSTVQSSRLYTPNIHRRRHTLYTTPLVGDSIKMSASAWNNDAANEIHHLMWYVIVAAAAAARSLLKKLRWSVGKWLCAVVVTRKTLKIHYYYYHYYKRALQHRLPLLYHLPSPSQK